MHGRLKAATEGMLEQMVMVEELIPLVPWSEVQAAKIRAQGRLKGMGITAKLLGWVMVCALATSGCALMRGYQGPPKGAVLYQHQDGRRGWCYDRSADHALALMPLAALTSRLDYQRCVDKFQGAGFEYAGRQ